MRSGGDSAAPAAQRVPCGSASVATQTPAPPPPPPSPSPSGAARAASKAWAAAARVGGEGRADADDEWLSVKSVGGEEREDAEEATDGRGGGRLGGRGDGGGGDELDELGRHDARQEVRRKPSLHETHCRSEGGVTCAECLHRRRVSGAGGRVHLEEVCGVVAAGGAEEGGVRRVGDRPDEDEAVDLHGGTLAAGLAVEAGLLL